MKKSIKKSSEKEGLPPGTLIHVGNTHQGKCSVSAIAYNSKELKEIKIDSVEELLEYNSKDYVVLVNVIGLNDINLIENIGKIFGIHSLVLEDIMNTNQRVKFDDYQDYLFFVMKKIEFESDNIKIVDEQSSMLLIKNFVFTFNEKADPQFEALLHRLCNSSSKIRQRGADYLVYALIDSIVDHYFILLDRLDEISESIDDELVTNPTIKTLHTIQAIKRELISTKKSVSPLREMLSSILRTDSPLITDKTQIYFRDIYDHSIRIIETLDSYRELVSGMLDIYLSSMSNKMNAVMKVLTIFASIFIPLTFVAGVYGMNFKYMPELDWQWSYPLVWCVFILIAVILLIFFKRKKWL